MSRDTPTPASASRPDLRRAISRPTWLANRAKNALQRPTFIGAIGTGTFVTALVSMLIVPRAPRPAPLPVFARPDTLTVVASLALARVQLAQTESTLAVSRADLARASASKPPDTAAVMDSATRDSISTRVAVIRRALARAEQAPLPSSYKAIAGLPEMRVDPRARALADSLNEIERERDSFGAAGGVDPMFVALTSHANQIGGALRSIAEQRVAALEADGGTRIAARSDSMPAAAPDTARRAAVRDSLRASITAMSDSLTYLRGAVHNVDLEEDRARARASAIAPPFALLASAFVLSAVIGFAVALIGELRVPRVCDATELERYLDVRVLSTVAPYAPSLERSRREADRSAPPFLDPSAQGFQLTYLGLATEHPTLLASTVTGDDPAIVAVVACNLAAVAADEARTTLLLDIDPSCSVSATLRAPTQPGVADVLVGRASLADVRVEASVGRDRKIDLIPYGSLTGSAPDSWLLRLQTETSNLARNYDAVFVTTTVAAATQGLPAAVEARDLVYCARPGRTPLRELGAQLDRIREAGASIRGVVLWNADRPMLPPAREGVVRPERPSSQSPVALAAS